MELNFLRHCEVVIGDRTLTSDNYEIYFNIDRRKSNKQTTGVLFIHYVSQDTKDLFGKGKEVKIIAGYEKGTSGLVFSGKVDKIEWNEKDGIDVTCTEDNKTWTNEIVNKAFKSGDNGVKLKDIVKNVIEHSSIKYGVIDCDDFLYERGVNLQGTLKSELTKLSKVVGATTYVKKNKIYFVKEKYSSLETSISSDTGLMKIKKTDEGYNLVMMLNHRIEEDMLLNVKGRDLSFKANASTVSHKYDRSRFETVIESVEVK